MFNRQPTRRPARTGAVHTEPVALDMLRPLFLGVLTGQMRKSCWPRLPGSAPRGPQTEVHARPRLLVGGLRQHRQKSLMEKLGLPVPARSSLTARSCEYLLEWEDRPAGRSCWKTRPPQHRARAFLTQIKSATTSMRERNSASPIEPQRRRARIRLFRQ